MEDINSTHPLLLGICIGELIFVVYLICFLLVKFIRRSICRIIKRKKIKNSPEYLKDGILIQNDEPSIDWTNRTTYDKNGPIPPRINYRRFVKDEDIKVGEYFWAVYKGGLVIITKKEWFQNCSYYVINGSVVNFEDFEFVSLIDVPRGYEGTDK